MMMNGIRIGDDRRNEWPNGQRLNNMPPTITGANDTELTGTPNAPNKPKTSGVANKNLDHIPEVQ